MSALSTYIVSIISCTAEATIHYPVLLFVRRQWWYLVSTTWINTHMHGRQSSWHRWYCHWDGWYCCRPWRKPPAGRWNSPSRWHTSLWTAYSTVTSIIIIMSCCVVLYGNTYLEDAAGDGRSLAYTLGKWVLRIWEGWSSLLTVSNGMFIN